MIMKRIIDDLKQENYTLCEVVKYGVVYPLALFAVLAVGSLLNLFE